MNDFYEAHRWEVHRVQFLDRVSVLLLSGQLRVNP
jgi:hypothetical protein